MIEPCNCESNSNSINKSSYMLTLDTVAISNLYILLKEMD